MMLLAALWTITGLGWASDPQVPQTTLVFTASNRGELRPCGCPGAVFGGLAKRATLLDQLQEELGSFTLLDAGDLLFPDRPTPAFLTASREEKARGVLRAYQAMDYSLVAGTPRDTERASTDLRTDEDFQGVLATQPSARVQAGSVEILVVPLTSDGLSTEAKQHPGPVVVLTGLLDDEVAPLIASQESVWMVLSSSPENNLYEPSITWANHVPILRPTPQGKDLTVVRLQSDSRQHGSGHTQRQTREDPGGQGYMLKVEDRRLEVEFRRIPRDTTDHPAVADIIRHAERTAFEAEGGEPWQEWEGQTYAGVAACAGCHPAETRQWQRTGHASALSSLQDEQQSHQNTDCIQCHTTGHGQAGGFVRAVSIGVFGDVQCEVCHGPSLAHVYAPDTERTPLRRPDESLCLECHSPDRSDAFEFESYLKRATCIADPSR